MSYILDALKKAEQARSAGKAPDLFTLQANEAVQTRKPMWPWLLAGLLVINAAAIFYWMQFRPGDHAVTTANPAMPAAPPPAPLAKTEEAAQERQAAATIADREPLPEKILPPVTPPRPVKPIEPKTTPVKPATKDSAQTAASATQSPPPAIVANPTAPPATAAPPPQPVAPPQPEPPAEPRTLSYAELPPAIQRELPKMAVSMHMYSGKPANRMASVNDKTIREGDELSPGLKLLEITPDGMIFSYRGYRFRKGLN
jgi:general secretion pathway protein B